MAAVVRAGLPPPPFLLLVCLAVVPAAQAQVIVYSTATAHGRIDVPTRVETPLAEDRNGLYTSDGQFGMSQAGTALRLWHVPTNQTTIVPTGFRPRHAHPRQQVVFGEDGGVPARLDATGVHAWPVCVPAPPNTSLAMDVSADGATLAVLCGTELVSIDTNTGTLTHRLPNAGVSGQFALNADGTEVIAWRSSGLPAELVRVRLSDGQVLASRHVSDTASGARLTSTPQRDRVVASTCRIVGVNIRCPAVLVNASDLTSVRTLWESLYFPAAVSLSPDGRDAFVSDFSAAAWIEIETGALRAIAPDTVITYLAAPLPPVLSPATVTGAAVAMSWVLPDASPQVNGYLLEAGAAPGATAVSIELGPALSTIVPGVPPGRYYARIRAVNYNGMSAPSNEVVIDVP